MAPPDEPTSPGDAHRFWDQLERPWQVAFDQAWESWCAGSYGIGACLIDPDKSGDDAIVAVGRNRIGEQPDTPGVLAGNNSAHAEMNVFAAMPVTSARGLHLYSTLEPCLMCAAAGIQLNLSHIHHLADDEYFVALGDLWSHHPYSAVRQPARSGPVGGPLATVSRALTLSAQMRVLDPSHRVFDAAARRVPAAFALAETLDRRGEFTAAGRDRAPFVDALSLIWDEVAPRT